MALSSSLSFSSLSFGSTVGRVAFRDFLGHNRSVVPQSDISYIAHAAKLVSLTLRRAVLLPRWTEARWGTGCSLLMILYWCGMR